MTWSLIFIFFYKSVISLYYYIVFGYFKKKGHRGYKTKLNLVMMIWFQVLGNVELIHSDPKRMAVAVSISSSVQFNRFETYSF